MNFFEKKIVSVYWKAIALGHPIVIAPYNESVGLTPFDSYLPILPEKCLLLASYRIACSIVFGWFNSSCVSFSMILLKRHVILR